MPSACGAVHSTTTSISTRDSSMTARVMLVCLDELHTWFIVCHVTTQFELEAGDVVIVATDGLFDNMFDNQVG